MISPTSDIEKVRRERDPIRQGVMATELIIAYEIRIKELSDIRKTAIENMRAIDLSYSDIADAFGLTKGRIGQICKDHNEPT
jgi:DNA-directed RNA polymerase specialized sigma24 family protein